MPTVDDNLRRWNQPDWSHNENGEKWSTLWGGSETQWHGSLYFRLHQFLPCRRILEIAPGYGRWTQYLKDICEELHVVDLSPNCIDACRRRFAADSRVTCHVNDGCSLAMVPGDVNLIFSFDSLVHVELDVIDGYLAQFRRILAPDGVAFIHHSNMAAYMKKDAARLPREILDDALNTIWRAESVDAAAVDALAAQYDLAVIGQEFVSWGLNGFDGTSVFTDCFSLLTHQGSRWHREKRVVHNEQYLSGEAAHMKRLGDLYNGTSFTKP